MFAGYRLSKNLPRSSKQVVRVEVALPSRRLGLAGIDCERPHQSTLLPKSSFLKAQFCGVEMFDRFHQAAISG